MSPPRRRSARLQTGNGSPQKTQAAEQMTSPKLSSLVEGDEAPATGIESTLDTIAATPIAPLRITKKSQSSPIVSPNVRTPKTESRLQPPREEMHPSKVYQSTTKRPDSGLRFGFIDVNKDNDPVHARAKDQTLMPDTPTKTYAGRPDPAASPGFEFRFTKKTAELSTDAQKMMDELREVALKEKANLIAQKEEETRKNKVDEQPLAPGQRRIATPKGKTGRYSDVHMAEFKKMDSIAGHASAYRASPGRVPITSPTKSLKRTKSDAKLDERETAPKSHQPPERQPLIRGSEPAQSSPSKRIKQNARDDTASVRPVTREDPAPVSKSAASTTGVVRRLGLSSVFMTPTKASLARSASVKHVKSALPSLARSGSSRLPGHGAKTEGSSKYLSSLANIGKLKSILRRPQYPTLNAEIVSPVGTSQGIGSLNKDLPELPSLPEFEYPKSPLTKHVNFTPSTVVKARLDNSPSPSKIMSPGRVLFRTPQYNSPSRASATVTYPKLPEVPPAESPDRNFSFRSPINYGNGPSTMTSTIRQVRPSVGGPDIIPATTMPSGIPHGMPNKKRHRDDSDNNESDIENREPQHKRVKGPLMRDAPKVPPRGSSMSPNKRPPVNTTISMAGSRIPSPVKKRPTTGSAMKAAAERGRAKAAGVLSMSRLNALARPKERKG